MRRYAYLHGFASSPEATKALALHEAFAARGLSLLRPDLNRPSFAKLSLAAMLAEMDRVAAEAPQVPLCLVGSSLGGYVAATWAARHPERVERLVLLCPAFQPATIWPVITGPAAFEAWRHDGEILVPDARGALVAVHFGFYEEIARGPAEPNVRCPTRIVHGTRDLTVPIASSRAYVVSRPHVSLLELDDDHRLVASTPRVVAEVFAHFGLDGTGTTVVH